MMKKGLKISIFMLIATIFACGFFSTKSTEYNVYAAETQGCYYLLGESNNPYLSNTEVGTIDGTGKYVLGDDAVELTAKAKPNYQIVGWQIIYEDQDNLIQYENVAGLASKTITLKDKDGVEILATVTSTLQGSFATTSKFKLDDIFENLIVRPVFDHIYYQVKANDLVYISSFANAPIAIDENSLYYDEVTTNAGVKKYSNSYIKIGTSYFYYGDIYEEDSKYYTIHETLTDEPAEQKVDYLRGAYRANQTVEINKNVNITADITTSKNIDLRSVSVGSTALTLKTVDITKDYYSFEVDSYRRTSSIKVNFTIKDTSTYQNVIDITYHNLYLVDLNVTVDGVSASASDLTDILGEVAVTGTQFKSNIVVDNFYSVVDQDELKFMIKSAIDNNNKSFTVNCLETISKTLQASTYIYYQFNTLNGTDVSTQSYTNIIDNLTLAVDYEATDYNVSFACYEYTTTNQGVVYNEIPSVTVDSKSFKRGDTKTFEQSDFSSINIPGYTLIGFSKNVQSEVEDTITYTVDKEKPRGTTILLCFEKIAYKVVLANYNKTSISGVYPISKITFNASGVVSWSENVTQTNLNNSYNAGTMTYDPYVLTNGLKVGAKLSFTPVINNGFEFTGFSLKDPTQTKTSDDYIQEFTLSSEFISLNNLTDTIVLYVYEGLTSYTISYYIEKTVDSGTGNEVVMATIGVEDEASYDVVKYELLEDGSYKEINATNDNLDAIVAKIVISNLKLNDEVILTSKRKSSNYEFNYFAEVGRPPLSYEVDDVDIFLYKRIENVTRNREIKVVYAMTSTKMIVSLQSDFITLVENGEFNYAIEVSQSGFPISPTDNSYQIIQGERVDILIKGLTFGYNFSEYQVLSGGVASDTIDVIFVENADGLYKKLASGAYVYAEDGYAGVKYDKTYSCTYTPAEGANQIILTFERIGFKFYFEQYGGVKDGGGEYEGEKVIFGLNEFINLDIDSANIEIVKPDGYYVAIVKINEEDTLSSVLCENNNYRTAAENNVYNFRLAKNQFKDIIANYSNVLEDGTIEVFVELYYSIYTYKFEIQYNVTNPKNDGSESLIQYSKIELTYNYDGEDKVETKEHISFIVSFSGIPYGTDISLAVLNGAPEGFSFAGWKDFSDNIIDNANVSENGYLKSNVMEDTFVTYNLTYIGYILMVDYDNVRGNPDVYLNDVLLSNADIHDEKIQITMFDKIQIETNPRLTSGYQFENLYYFTPSYVEYVYDAKTWANCWKFLFIDNGGEKVLNTSSVYNPENEGKYYILDKSNHNASLSFEEFSFNVLNYGLVGNKVYYVIEYDYLELTISNIINQDSISSWIGLGVDESKISFEVSELINFEIRATSEGAEERVVADGDIVDFLDDIVIVATINNAALNTADGKYYNLSLGLTIDTATANGQNIYATVGNNGVYTYSFEITSDYLNIGVNSDKINIVYSLGVKYKNINVTTIVPASDATGFYSNTILYQNPRAYGFGEMMSTELWPASNLEYSYIFLGTTQLYVKFTTTYESMFKVSGVNLYNSDGGIIKDENDNFARYGISISEDWKVTVKAIENIKAVFMIQPIITFKDDITNFEKYFDFTITEENVGGYEVISIEDKEQTLSKGTQDSDDIKISELLKDDLVIKYRSVAQNSNWVDSVTTSGLYYVQIKFNSTDYPWLNDVSIAEEVTLRILPKEIELVYDKSAPIIQQTYNGSHKVAIEKITNNLKYKINNNLISYSKVKNTAGNVLKLSFNTNYVTIVKTIGKDIVECKDVNNELYNVQLSNLNLHSIAYNNNFVLKVDNSTISEDLIIKEIVKITPKTVTLQGIQVLDKVYNGTTDAKFVIPTEVTIVGKIETDDVLVDGERISVKFDNQHIGAGKIVTIDASAALSGGDAKNYTVANREVENCTIYPNMLFIDIAGYGRVALMNIRGETENDKVGLIPLNATFTAEPIYMESQEYINIYSSISDNLKGNKEYIVGYKLIMMVGGEKVNIDKNLHLSIPNVKGHDGVYYLTGQQTDKVDYTVQGGQLIIDLMSINVDIDSFYLTRKKSMLKPWQIVLIVTSAVLAVSAVVLTFVIIRKKKAKSYGVHEKI